MRRERDDRASLPELLDRPRDLLAPLLVVAGALALLMALYAAFLR